MNYQKLIISDLIKYCMVDNQIINIPSINNGQFQFIRKYEDAESITDSNILPVLLITTPDMYMKGKILYKDNYHSLKSLLVTDNITTKKINFFVIPQVMNIQGNHLGTLGYVLNVDYNYHFDPYGFIANELNQILKNLYYKERCGNYYNITKDGRQFWFVPKVQSTLTDGTIIHRIRHDFNVRSCNFT